MLTRLHPERIDAASYVPTAGCDLGQLTNDELIAGTRRLVGASNQVLAMLLAHLAEVEARGIHRQRACSSLYTYCIYELRFSEDAAFRRVSATTRPSWADFVESLSPVVRELQPGDAPRDWMNDELPIDGSELRAPRTANDER